MRRARSGWIALALLMALPGVTAHAADVVIGVAVPLSGPKRALGEGIRQALERDASAVNAAGGILGSPIRLAVIDDGCQPALAEAAARSLLAEAPAVVIGHPCSSAAVAAAKLYISQGAVFIATGARHPALTAPAAALASPPRPQVVFRLAGRDDRQGQAGAQWLLENAPEKRVAIIHDRTAYARDIAEDAGRALKAAGIAEPPVLTLVSGKAAYPDILAKLKTLNAEAVLFAGYPNEAAIVVEGARREGLGLAFLGSDSLATPEFTQRIGEDRGTRVLMRLEPGDISNEGVDGPMAKRAEAALEMWAQAVRAAGTFEPTAVAATLRGGDFETRSMGRVSFDDRGDSREPSYGIARSVGEHWTLIGK
jgi:branched-chain amino acid transport system substrate-binding protein